MSKRIARLLLEDILDAIRKIQEFIASKDFQTFLEDEKTIDAVIRNFEVIGEATNQLPSEITDAYTDPEWQKIIGVRN